MCPFIVIAAWGSVPAPHQKLGGVFVLFLHTWVCLWRSASAEVLCQKCVCVFPRSAKGRLRWSTYIPHTLTTRDHRYLSCWRKPRHSPLTTVPVLLFYCSVCSSFCVFLLLLSTFFPLTPVNTTSSPTTTSRGTYFRNTESFKRPYIHIFYLLPCARRSFRP